MTTIINSPGNGEDSSGVASMVIGFIIILILGALFFVYALPAIRNASQSPEQKDTIDINVKLPQDATPPAPTQ